MNSNYQATETHEQEEHLKRLSEAFWEVEEGLTQAFYGPATHIPLDGKLHQALINNKE